MNVISRGVRNTFRNGIRTFSIVIILGISVGLALAMLVARQAVEAKIASVKSSVGNTITVSPAGSRGFEGGGEPLTGSQLTSIKTLPHISGLTESLNDRLASSDSNLTSAIDAGSLGRRRANNSGVGFTPPAGDNVRGNQDGTTRTFTPPVLVTASSNVSAASVYGGSSISFTGGQAFDPGSNDNIAVVGKDLASKNNLSVGSTFTAYNTEIKVVGIYDAGNTFANAGLVMPLSTLQRLSNQTDAITSATVLVDSISNVDSVTSSISSKLGSTADVVSNTDTAKQAVAPLENIKTISVFSLIGALVAGSVIILLTMIMIVRERRREIGVMKAIGSSNIKTVTQFMAEAVTLTLLGSIVGLGLGVVAANPITKVLVNNSTNTTQSQTAGAPAPGQGATGNGGFRTVRTFGNSSAANLRTIHTSVGWSVLLYGLGAAVVIAIVGSALPAWFISKIRPAEVMRAE